MRHLRYDTLSEYEFERFLDRYNDEQFKQRHREACSPSDKNKQQNNGRESKEK